MMRRWVFGWLLLLLLAGCGSKPNPDDFLGLWKLYLPISPAMQAQTGLPGLNVQMELKAGGVFEISLPKGDERLTPESKTVRGTWGLEGRGENQKMMLKGDESNIGQQSFLFAMQERKGGGKSGPLTKFALFHPKDGALIVTRVEAK